MKKRDFILIGSILAVAALALVIWFCLPKGSYVIVTVGEGTEEHEIARYSLSMDGEYELNGGTNVLKIEDGKAWMIEANCPQNDPQACTKHWKISRVNEKIACLPNQLVVTVYGDDGGDDETTVPEIIVGQ